MKSIAKNGLKRLLEWAHRYLALHRGIRFLSEIIARLVPPDNRLVLFGAINGKLYGDNSRHLFEWIQANRPDLRVVWLTIKVPVLKEVRELGYPCHLIQRPVGIFLLFRARVGVFTNSLGDLAISPYLIPNRLRLIALRHGRSIKNVRFARKNHQISSAEARERKRESRLILFATSTSEFVSRIQEDCLRIGIEKHQITGYPRNDILVSGEPGTRHLLQERYRITPRLVVLYGPSWRHGREPTRFFPFEDFNLQELLERLESESILMLLRPHFRDLEKYNALRTFIAGLANSSPYIRVASHAEFPDVNKILPEIDCLISDYSALYHDFLLLDRPMAFIPYDFEEFQKENGFSYDYFGNLPGPALTSQADLLQMLDNLRKGIDSHTANRQRLRDKIHFHKDTNACLRVSKLIDTALKNHAC